MLLDFVNKIWGCPRVLWDRLVAITPQKTHVVSTGTQETRWKMFTAKVEQLEALKMLTAASCSFCRNLLCFLFSSTWVLLKLFVLLLSKGSLKLFFLWINQSTKTTRVISCYLVICQWSKCLPSDNLLILRYLLSKRPGKSKIVKVKPFFRR